MPARPPSVLLTGALLLLLPAGCTPEFEEVWLVRDLRILGVQVEPPEVLVTPGSTSFPPVRVRPLVTDPRAAGDALFEWQLWACTSEEVGCEKATRRVLVAVGRDPLPAIEADFVLDQALHDAAIEKDVARGFGGVAIMLELRVASEAGTDRALKRVVYGNPIPAEKTPNANPSLGRLLVDGKELRAGTELQAAAGQTVKLLPEPAPGARESYWVATFRGPCTLDTECGQGAVCKDRICARRLEEFLSYAFFTTSGELSDASTGGKPTPFAENKKIADPSSDWTAPAAPGRAELWVVVRDDRGGVGWTKVQADVR